MMTMEVLPDCAQAIADTSASKLKQMEPCAQSNTQPSPNPPPPNICVGCNRPIQEQYLLHIHPSLTWHPSCLKCAHCNKYLDENCTCFLRDGRTYCKQDFYRLFHCSKCSAFLKVNEMVMRAQSRVYHADCFRCTTCRRLLTTGETFAERDGELYCKDDLDFIERNLLSSNDPDNLLCSDNNNHKMHPQDKRSSMLHENPCSNKIKRSKDGKPTRVRTVLSEKQLQTLRQCYGANPRPDALMKEQLVEMTGLSARVIRVWFQNKRCKDKKKSIMIKHLQQQQDKSLSSGIQGVAMVAHSPLRHDNGLKSIESYHHQAWKQIPEYPPQQEEINHNSFPSLMGSLYGSSDESAVYINEEEYLDCMQPDSVSSQFSGASTSPHSSA
ncbi:insulin gene enhancer protein ISL-1-like [Watersipora subatra]|uniref:insulin gene enhancer protein ISL-1-like n=1 Tax=Watersipora subatra TaxID=2589382 RepID=UPI00355BE0AA